MPLAYLHVLFSCCSTHQFIQVLLFLCHLLLCTTQLLITFHDLLLQISNLRQNEVNVIIVMIIIKQKGGRAIKLPNLQEYFNILRFLS